MVQFTTYQPNDMFESGFLTQGESANRGEKAKSQVGSQAKSTRAAIGGRIEAG